MESLRFMPDMPASPQTLLVLVLILPLFFLLVSCGFNSATAQDFLNEKQISATVAQFAANHDSTLTAQFERGVRQIAGLWRETDGTAAEFTRFCLDNFITDAKAKQLTADRFEAGLESIDGFMGEMNRRLSWNFTVDNGPLLPIDYTLAEFAPGTHLSEDLFAFKLAFIALLNYPIYSLEELIANGQSMSREEWAQARLAGRFSARIPADVSKALSEAFNDAGVYIDQYNIYMHHLLTPDGKRPFPRGMKLISHWNIRDELKARYPDPEGLRKQEMIYEVMLKIINQTIPKAVINNPAVDWEPAANRVTISPEVDGDIPSTWKTTGQAGDPVDAIPELDARYQHILDIFRAQRMADPYFPKWPTLMDRRFKLGREMFEGDVEKLFETVLSAKILPQIAQLIEKRLGRKLRPYDIWYDGFKARSDMDGRLLDSLVASRYKDAASFEADMPNMLVKLGFDDEKARFITSKIGVDPSRGVGHAEGPNYRGSTARLRTRVTSSGMDYKGYNIATHEFGHNVEQIISSYMIDHVLLRGVPNTAFTEAFAFAFQARDLELLGLSGENPEKEALAVLDDFWGTYEISGVSLVDMKIWRWMYAHPEASPQELKAAVVAIAREVWNQYFAPVLGVPDCEILAVYSHIINSALYLPDYAIGALISFQIEDYLKGKNLGQEMIRMCSIGSLTPDEWMRQAVGHPISADPIIAGAEKAVKTLK